MRHENGNENKNRSIKLIIAKEERLCEFFN